MASLPKLELRIIVPTGGWPLSLTDADGAGVALTFPAGTYYLTTVAPGGTQSFLGQLALTLTNGAGVTYTVVLDDNSDTSTGKITVTVSSGTFTIAWTNTTLRDTLGFTGASTASSGTAAVAPNQARRLWLPNVQRQPETPDPALGEASQDFGRPETDYILTVAPSGASTGTVFSQRRVDKLVFDPVLGQRMWLANEQVVNESFERFWLDWYLAGSPPIRYHNDRANDAVEWSLIFDADVAALKPVCNVRGWVGVKSHWRLELGVRKYVTVNGV